MQESLIKPWDWEQWGLKVQMQYCTNGSSVIQNVTAAGSGFFCLETHKRMYHLHFFFKLTRPPKARMELFVQQILLSDLRLDNFKFKIQNLINLFD